MILSPVAIEQCFAIRLPIDKGNRERPQKLALANEAL